MSDNEKPDWYYAFGALLLLIRRSGQKFEPYSPTFKPIYKAVFPKEKTINKVFVESDLYESKAGTRLTNMLYNDMFKMSWGSNVVPSNINQILEGDVELIALLRKGFQETKTPKDTFIREIKSIRASVPKYFTIYAAMIASAMHGYRVDCKHIDEISFAGEWLEKLIQECDSLMELVTEK
jgi:hypothetical protein